MTGAIFCAKFDMADSHESYHIKFHASIAE
jgi:hypothetical protein